MKVTPSALAIHTHDPNAEDVRQPAPNASVEAIRHILVPVDFGKASDRAVGVAADLASAFSAEITLLHVVSVPAYAYAEGVTWPDDWTDRAKRDLDVVASRMRASGLKVHADVEWGSAWERILEVERRVGADLVVMGTHGRRGLAHALLGSVAERVVRLSPAPVLTVQALQKKGKLP